jgi:chaperonin GroEL (HSP60 family)
VINLGSLFGGASLLGAFTSVPDRAILLVEDIDVQEGDVDTTLSVEDPDGRAEFLDRRDAALQHKVQQVVDTGADVLLNQKGIEDDVHHVLAEEGLLAVRRVTKDEMTFLGNVLDAELVSDLDDATSADVGHANVTRGPNGECFHVRGTEGTSGATILLRGSTQHVVDELERSVEDALDAVVTALSHGRVVAGGGATEVELADRLRESAGSVSGREQLAVESYADAVELVPRTLAESAGLDGVDVMTELRVAHADGDSRAGLNVRSGEVEDTFDAGVVEPAGGKEQALTSATEAANAILKIDDIITVGDDDEGVDRERDAGDDADDET